jgi:hypothetical protein
MSFCGFMLFLQHQMLDSYRFLCSEHESVKVFGKKSRDVGVGGERFFAPNFSKMRFSQKKLFSLKLKIQKNHRKTRKTYFDKTQNCGVNHDDGFQIPYF